jgi:capsular polysaccharide biosynthesis protein
LQPRDYVPVLRKRWALILAVAVVAVVASFLFTRLQTPVYRAHAHLIVSPSRIADFGQNMAIESQLRGYARQLNTDRIAEEVNNKLQLDLPIARMRANMRASAVMDDLTLQLEVDDIDERRARDIAAQWAKQFVEFHQNRMASVAPSDRIEVTLLDDPQPAVLNWPKRNQTLLAAAILGLIVGTLLAFVLEYVDDTLKSTQDVDRYLSTLPVLGAIPAPETNGHGRGRKVPAPVGLRSG